MRGLLTGRCPSDRTRTMRPIEPFAPKCQLCGYADNDKQRLYEHLRSHFPRAVLQPAAPTGPCARPTATQARPEGYARRGASGWGSGGGLDQRLRDGTSVGGQACAPGGQGRDACGQGVQDQGQGQRPRQGLRAPGGDGGHDGQALAHRGQGRGGHEGGGLRVLGARRRQAHGGHLDAGGQA
eukprot:3148917-Pyramimonas_sp.AAC.1